MSCNWTVMTNVSRTGVPPTHELVDYAEIAVLAALVLAGFPLNMATCVRVMRSAGGKKSQTSLEGGRATVESNRHRQRAASPMLVLEFHVTLASLLIICPYSVGQICWLCTYSWMGGDTLCRLVKFMDAFCFYAASNIVAVIAIDRAYVSFRVDDPNRRRRHSRLFSYRSALAVALALAWALALVCSVPQLLVWRVFTPYPRQYPNWHQCVTIFGDNDRGLERLYAGLHLILVFWVPFLIVLFSYALIVFRLREVIAANIRDARIRQRAVNAITFKKRATSYHKKCRRQRSREKGTRDKAGANGRLTVPEDRDAGQRHSSAGSLAAVPIVIDCSHAFACQPTVSSRAVKTLTRAQKRTIKTAFWIVLAYLICWTPYNTLVLWRYLDQQFKNRFIEFTSNLIVLNAVLNPLIYKI